MTGAHNYVTDAIRYIDPSTPLRRAFIEHLRHVSEAMYRVERVDEGNASPGEDEKAIARCLPPHAELAQLVREAKAAQKALASALAAVDGAS
jgi:hypothetical protein